MAAEAGPPPCTTHADALRLLMSHLLRSPLSSISFFFLRVKLPTFDAAIVTDVTGASNTQHANNKKMGAAQVQEGKMGKEGTAHIYRVSSSNPQPPPHTHTHASGSGDEW